MGKRHFNVPLLRRRRFSVVSPGPGPGPGGDNDVLLLVNGTDGLLLVDGTSFLKLASSS